MFKKGRGTLSHDSPGQEASLVVSFQAEGSHAKEAARKDLSGRTGQEGAPKVPCYLAYRQTPQ